MRPLRGPARTRRPAPIADVRTAFWVSLIDTVTIGCWFTLVVIESRTHFTALAGLGVLWFGALLRTGFVVTSLGWDHTMTNPRWIVVSGIYTAIWIGWLLIAEGIGGRIGVSLAGAVLVVALTLHFAIANGMARPRAPRSPEPGSIDWSLALAPAVVLASGATVLLGLVWYVDVTMYATTLAVGTQTIVLEVDTIAHGIAAFGCGSFLGTHRLLSSAASW
ncbi:hypothetical protein [Halovivax cerinus]|uniref:Uncharacterized protein n=1 Tax=Halovivax cerinus TaxID=1487865 RepID=A0ABD5NNR1_9EURY|nr:hypothetical protein [Halovivax cerinus]